MMNICNIFCVQRNNILTAVYRYIGTMYNMYTWYMRYNSITFLLARPQNKSPWKLQNCLCGRYNNYDVDETLRI